MRIKKINMDEEGLNRFFGSLEAKIMDIIWTKGRVTIKEVHRMIDDENPISVNAVMTVMTRLVEKEYLIRESTGKGRSKVSHFYAPQTKEQFITEQTRAVTDSLFADFGTFMVKNLIDNLDSVDPDLIKQLELKLKEMRQDE
ncbi:BlaI/MecI/CopY family transcriptional regulator [Paenibacillus lautus]